MFLCFKKSTFDLIMWRIENVINNFFNKIFYNQGMAKNVGLI